MAGESTARTHRLSRHGLEPGYQLRSPCFVSLARRFKPGSELGFAAGGSGALLTTKDSMGRSIPCAAHACVTLACRLKPGAATSALRRVAR